MTDTDSSINTLAEGTHNQGNPNQGNHNSGLASLLRSALQNLAWSHKYSGVVEDIHLFVNDFNKRNPEYEERLGYKAVLYNAEKLKERGWK